MTQVEFWSLLVDSLSTILAAIAVLLYVIIWRRDKISNTYDVFDSLYLDILKIGIEEPHLRDSKLTINYKAAYNENELIQYESYAFICWNFIETIYDRGDEELYETWVGVLETEYKLHRAWFFMPENQVRFKEKFKKFVREKLDN
jgi:hypothetical protein